LFHAKHWYYERFDFGWDELESFSSEFHDFLDLNFLYGITGVKLYKKNINTDSLVYTFSGDDIFKRKELQMHSGNNLILVEFLRSRLKPVDEASADMSNPQDYDYFNLTWKGDTATLENYRIEGEYYLVLKRD
jgi:hypothetical protein